MDNNEKEYGGYVSSIHFNNGCVIDINKNDIVVFVGPNNVGKSQTLKDIYNLSGIIDSPQVVVKEINVTKAETQIEELLKRISTLSNNSFYQGYGYSVSKGDIDYISSSSANFFTARSVFVAHLDTAQRLAVCTPPEIIDRDEPVQHPIHLVVRDHSLRKKMSECFSKAFGTGLIPNTQFGRSVPLCIGNDVYLNDKEFSDEQTRMEEYGDYLNSLPQVQNQGDGIKSFVGILLNLIVDYYRIFLIDEPESFLHPPQARIIGHTIGELLSEHQQAFISTHSSEVIKGLMEKCPERVKIIRITRKDKENDFAVLDNANFITIWKDPLLKYSEIMSGMFHKSVVLCESDSDCRFYSMVADSIKAKQKTYSESLFIHCGGKQRLAKVVCALRSLRIEYRVVTDTDILNDKNVFESLVVSAGGVWDSFETDYRILESSLSTPKSSFKKDTIRKNIKDILDRSEEKTLSKDESSEIVKLFVVENKWDKIKKSGINGAPQGDGYSALTRILEKSKGINIYIVPVGELECFVKTVGGHGPEWVNKVLEQYPDLNDPVYKEAVEFIQSWNI